MSLFADLQVLYHMACKPIRGKDHAQRLDSFYAGQASAYDNFRKRLLKGRREMYQCVQVPPGGTWVDMGGGTASNLEYLEQRLDQLRQVYVVDLSSSLLKVARQRIASQNWQNVQAVKADATEYQPDEGKVDAVTFSYSLTMIPDWFAAIDNAARMLGPEGVLGVVDFYVSRKYPSQDLQRHSWFQRHFWPTWFSNDNVHPSADHVPYLHRHFEPIHFSEHRARIPYLPLVRVPYYIFVGKPRRQAPS